MPTDAKRQAVTDLAELLRGSSALAVADYRGLTVSEMHIVRRALRANGVSLKVAKNRLLKIAADEAGLADLKPMLDGPTAIASTTGDEISLARALQDAFRPYKVVTLRGGLLGGQPVGAADLQRLATLPSREVLLARLAGGMAAPLTGMAAVLAANLRNLVGVLSAVVDQKRETEGSASPAPAADTAEVAPAPDAESAGAPAVEAAEVTTEDAPTEEASAEAVAEATEAVDDAAPAEAAAPAEETAAEAVATDAEETAPTDQATETTDSETTDSESTT